jgi:hypothetical protein
MVVNRIKEMTLAAIQFRYFMVCFSLNVGGVLLGRLTPEFQARVVLWPADHLEMQSIRLL